ncbi:MAG: rod shape-determining protein MreC [Legionellales bacterium]|nr:rod shape-determining protein MreC [Legionellales bacterium]|tara:strand:+ start:90505 stop:91425 length:921 start_codon:yes stop_codon:yes gene_type:complete
MLFRQGSLFNFRFFLLLVLSVVLMVVDHRQHHLDKLRQALTTVIAPVQYVVDFPVDFFGWVTTSMATHKALVNDNANLRADNLLLKAQVQRILAVEKENSQLRALLQSSTKAGLQVHVARLLAVSTDAYVTEVVIDKGTNDGAFVGQPVLDANGVMGQVIQTSLLTSRVMLVTDPRSAVPVQDDRNGLRAIAIGTGAHRTLQLADITETANVEVGDTLSTTGLGLRYPSGYPLGKVVSVNHQPGEQFARVKVQPSARINQSRQVLLVSSSAKSLVNEGRRQVKAMEKSHREQLKTQRVTNGVRGNV